MLTKRLKKEIESLPGDSLREIETLIKTLRTRKTPNAGPEQGPYSVFNDIIEEATDLGISDLAKNHDHYLYGTAKR